MGSQETNSRLLSYPLTEVQKQLWILAQHSDAGALSYNISLSLDLQGQLNRPIMRKALQQLTDRHDALRTTIDSKGESQYVQPELEVDAKLIDFSSIGHEQKESEVQHWIAQENSKVFDFIGGPLARFRILKFSETHHRLILTAHHIISDGWSLSLLMQELIELYSAGYYNRPDELKSPMQFGDFIANQNELQKNGAFSKNEAYWLALFESSIPVIELPGDYRRPKIRTFKAARASITLDQSYNLGLKKLARNHGSTLFMTLFTAFAVLLHRMTNQRDILIGTPSAGRFIDGSDNLIGYIGSLLPIKSNFDGKLDFGEFLKQQKSNLLAAYQHQEFSFAQLIRKLNLESTSNRSLLIDVIFNLELPLSLPPVPGLDMCVLTEATPYTSYDLFFNIAEIDGNLVLDLDFNTDIFSLESGERIIGLYHNLLDSILSETYCEISQLEWLNPEQKNHQLKSFNNTTVDFTSNNSIHGLFEAQAKKNPDAIALVYEDYFVSYRELNERANQLAHYLIDNGVKEGERVGLCVERSIPMFIALLAILKTGASYVPLDPEYPSDRLNYSAQDANIDILLTQDKFVEVVNCEPAKQLSLDNWRIVENFSRENPQRQYHKDNLAYIIYTSGSTGKPKGVAISHGSVVNLMSSLAKKPGLDSSERLLGITTFAFDMAVVELYLPLLVGASLVIAKRDSVFNSRQFYNQLVEQEIDVLQATPTAWRLLLSTGWKGPLNIRMMIGGEALTNELAETLVGQGNSLWHMYGPTETTVWSTSCQYVPDSSASKRFTVNQSVGKPIDNTSIYILDECLAPVPVGVTGMLYIGGQGLARCYWNRPDLTASQFIPDPFSDVAGERIYKTGDQARFLADGNIEFIGRVDNQVKVRGFRIELGEIEAILSQHQSITNAVVIAQHDRRGDNRLVAFVEFASGLIVNPSELKEFVKEKLPYYMIPSVITQLERLPLTPTGKIDRKALAAKSPEQLIQKNYLPPRSKLEKQLCEIWSEVLGQKKISINDSFFELGGHSLMAAQLVERIYQAVGFKFTLSQVFERNTIEEMVRLCHLMKDDDVVVNEEIPQISLDKVNRYKAFPLTNIQQAYWVGQSAAFELGNTNAYNYTEVTLPFIDQISLQKAWQRLLDRHDMLRVVILDNGEQRVEPSLKAKPILLKDLSKVGEKQRESELAFIREEMTFRPPQTYSGELYDIRLSKLHDDSYRLHMTLSMMIFDGASLTILYRELAMLLENPAHKFEPLTITFRDYVLAEKVLHASALYQKSKQYWLNRIDSLPPAPELALAKDPAAIETPLFSRRVKILAENDWTAIKTTAQSHGVTLSVLCTTVFTDVLASWSKSPHFTINLTLFNRLAMHNQINSVIGDFTSLTLLEVDNRPGQSFLQRVRDNQQQLWQDLEHRFFSGVEVVRELNRRRGTVQKASMPVVFTSDLSIVQSGEKSALERRISDQTIGVSQTPQVWLDVAVMDKDGELALLMDSVDELFPTGVLDNLLHSFVSLMQSLARQPQAWSSSERNFVPDDQLQRRSLVNDTTTVVSARLLHSAFEEQVIISGSAPAIITSSQVFSYQKLNCIANNIARQLRDDNCKPNSLVAVVMYKGWEQIAAVLGILKSGSAYLPIDASLPKDRIEQLIHQGEVKQILVQKGLPDLFSWPENSRCWVIENSQDFNQPCENLPVVQNKEDLAYVIFTSGSTGIPKGVMIDHLGAVNTVESINRKFEVNSNDRILALSSLSFDLSVYDIFGLLGVGGAVVIPEHSLQQDPLHWYQLLETKNVTLWNTVPALMQILVDFVEEKKQTLPESLRDILLSGDWIPLSLPPRIHKVASNIALTSLGGATEASIWSIAYPIGDIDSTWKSIPYGKPLANQTYHVLNKSLLPCPDWVPGDLYIGGLGVAKGYWKDEKKTTESFIQCPTTGDRLYRTGDLGRYLADGNIEFLGREDSQVKVQGYRIELGEIEATLNSLPMVKSSVVQAIGNAGENKRLVGYVVFQGERLAVQHQTNKKAQENKDKTIENALFKLTQPGLRKFNSDSKTVYLDASRREEGLLLTWDYADNRATQSPVNESLSKEALSQLLLSLAQIQVEGAPLPKYYYPSSGSLNPVQAYLQIGPKGVIGVSPGYYYYDPAKHALKCLKESSGGETDEYAIQLHLIAASEAIVPLYDDSARFLCEIESGYMQELLQSASLAVGIDLVETCETDHQRLIENFELSVSHWPMVSLTGRKLAAMKEGHSWFKRKSRNGCDAKRDTVIALPPVHISSQQRLAILERQSYRQFAKLALSLDSLSQLFAVLSPDDLGDFLEVYIYVMPEHVSDLNAGHYRYDIQRHALERVNDDDRIPSGRYAGGNAVTFAGAAVAIYLVAPKQLSTIAQKRAMVAAGRIGQRFASAAPKVGIGLCPIGGFNQTDLCDALTLSDDFEAVHSFLGGAIKTSQTLIWVEETAAQAGKKHSVEQLRTLLEHKLPTYMIPSVFMELDALPLTSNGKVNRKGLPKPEFELESTHHYVAPSNQLQMTLVKVWCDILRLNKVGVRDHFFEVGGDSIALVKMRTRLVETLQRDISVIDLFKYPTIETLAIKLTSEGNDSDSKKAKSNKIKQQANKQLEAAARMRKR